MDYPITSDQPIILPSLSEQIWEKFVYFAKKEEDYPNEGQYYSMRIELLNMWWEQFQKEYKLQGHIFKKGGKEERLFKQL